MARPPKTTLDPQVAATLGAIATVLCVADAHATTDVLEVLDNTFMVVRMPDQAAAVRSHHLAHTIAWGQELMLEAGALHATTHQGQVKTAIYVLMRRLEIALAELEIIKERHDALTT